MSPKTSRPPGARTRRASASARHLPLDGARELEDPSAKTEKPGAARDLLGVADVRIPVLICGVQHRHILQFVGITAGSPGPAAEPLVQLRNPDTRHRPAGCVR